MIVGPGKYSKDPSLVPEGIAVTLPKQFFDDREWGSYDAFTKMFEEYMNDPNQKEENPNLWNFRLTNLPTHDVAWVYIIYDGKFQFRTNLVQIERNVSKEWDDGPNGEVYSFPNANWLILAGPVVKAPEGWEQKGFQGFRYATFLF